MLTAALLFGAPKNSMLTSCFVEKLGAEFRARCTTLPCVPAGRSSWQCSVLLPMNRGGGGGDSSHGTTIMEPEADSAGQFVHHAFGEETEKRGLCAELRYGR